MTLVLHSSATSGTPALLRCCRMSRKVQEAILHSQRVFERQAAMVEQAVVQRAFYVSGQGGWTVLSGV